MPDPFKIPHGWMEKYERIAFWPILSYPDIFNFLMFYPSELGSKELRDFFCFASFFFFWLQQIFDYLFWKTKRHFGGILIIFTILGKKIGSRRHLPYLSKLTNLFSKNMSKFIVKNHFLFVLIFYSQVQQKWFLTLLSIEIEKCFRSIFSPLMSIIWAF